MNSSSSSSSSITERVIHAVEQGKKRKLRSSCRLRAVLLFLLVHYFCPVLCLVQCQQSIFRPSLSRRATIKKTRLCAASGRTKKRIRMDTPLDSSSPVFTGDLGRHFSGPDGQLIRSELNREKSRDAAPTPKQRLLTERIQRLLEDNDDRFVFQDANDVADKKTVFSQLTAKDRQRAHHILSNKASHGRKGHTKIMANVVETGTDSISSYVKGISSHQVLSASDEQVLGKHIQIFVKWEQSRQELEDAFSRPPTFAEWGNVMNITVPELKKQIRKSQMAKAALMEANMRLVVTVARQSVRLHRTEISFQDACQEGILGLSRACDKFDPERGIRFSTYATWWIKSLVQRSVTSQSHPVSIPTTAMNKVNQIRDQETLLKRELGRCPTPEEIGRRIGLTGEKVSFYSRIVESTLSLDKAISDAKGETEEDRTLLSTLVDHSPSANDVMNKQMFKDAIRRMIKTLSPREEAVIRLRFGFDNGKPRSLFEIGEKFNVDKETIKEIEARALFKLRQPFRNRNVKTFMPDMMRQCL